MEDERQVVAVTDRPLRVVDLLDGAFAALRYRPRVILLSVLWIVIPMAVLEGWNSRGVLGGGGLAGILNDPALAEEAAQGTGFSTTLATYAVDWVRVSLIGVSIAFLIDRWANGEDPTVMDVMRFTARRLPMWAVTLLLAKLAVLVGGVLLVLPGLAMVVGFAILSPVIAIERLGPIRSLRRSFALMRTRTGPVIGLYVACAVVGGLVAFALTAVPSMVALFIGTDLAWPLITVGAIVSSALLAPFNGAAMTLMYHDIRFRSEGLDIERRAGTLFPEQAVPPIATEPIRG